LNKTTELLKSVFGFDEFRPLQKEVVNNILNGHDSLVIMPTGGGKSLCYQLPALIFNGVTVVVSPLISLMMDQVDQLSALGIPAVVLNSAISYQQYQYNVQRIQNGEVKMLYLAPETLLLPKTLNLLTSCQVDCVTIDEAHCISEWGHDFRPEYRQLIDARKKFPNSVCVALTATATPRVREDIKNCLNFGKSNEFISSFNRTNLFLQIEDKLEPISQTLRFIKKFPNQSGLIYCLSRRQVDELSSELAEKGYSVKPYHAGLSDEERKFNQAQFVRDDIQIVVATIAFGMGINKPNIRFVVHFDLPKNIESYYQQIGRAGRNGLPAQCLLLYGYSDTHKIKYFINNMDKQEQRVARAHLKSLIKFVESAECRRIPLLNYFGETLPEENCSMCDNCVSEKEHPIDLTIPAQKFMSCVKRSGERFGVNHIIDILRGSNKKKVLVHNHDKLSTYGIGQEYSCQQWIYIAHQLLNKGLLEQDFQFNSIKLTPEAWLVMKGQKSFLGRLEVKNIKNVHGEKLEYDEGLFELLRALRKTLADRENVPPYVVFPDKTLIEMATFYPQSQSALREIHGVGFAKFEKFGDIFLKSISQFCQVKDIKEKPKYTIQSLNKRTKTKKKRKFEKIGERFALGKTVKDLLAEYKIKKSTLFEHLFKYTVEGNHLGCTELSSCSQLNEKERQKVYHLFDRLGTELLRPVFEALNGKVDYEELTLMRIIYLNREKTN
jgi:ATP-dependent DNA helicase RecQ